MSNKKFDNFKFYQSNCIYFRWKLQHEERYAASMKLKTPRSDLLTFGFIARDYKKDNSALLEMMLMQQIEQIGRPQIDETQSNNDETPPVDDPILNMVQRLIMGAN